MDTADYTLLRQCVPNARFASAALSNSARAAYSSAGTISLRNRNYARMRRHMALVIESNSKSHAKHEQSSQTADSTRIGPIQFGPSCCNDNIEIDDEEAEMALLEQVLRQSSGVAQF
ncbi:hypothetical protein GGI17_006027 [Coemansia sp. S146]|nr:hypothetical protein GGI17_006027 [Coemansia sp. S146]